MANLNFDATQVTPDEGRDYSPVPAGDYLLIVESTDVKPNKKGTGYNLELTHQIVDGQHKNRKVFDRITLSNRTSQEAERIGQAQLSALCHAVNVLKLTDSNLLHGKTYSATLKITPAKGEFPAKNEITKRSALSVQFARPVPETVAPLRPAPVVGGHMGAGVVQGQVPPWGRK